MEVQEAGGPTGGREAREGSSRKGGGAEARGGAEGLGGAPGRGHYLRVVIAGDTLQLRASEQARPERGSGNKGSP